MNPEASDGSREFDPMLGSRRSLDSETGVRSSRPEKQLLAGRPARRGGFTALMLLCIASVVLLVGFVSFQFTQLQTSFRHVDESKPGDAAQGQDSAGTDVEVVSTTTAALSSSSTSSWSTSSMTSTTSVSTASPPTASSTSPTKSQKPQGNVASAEQFELNRAFVVSDKPMLREYVFNITRDVGAPDGLSKSMILINGQSPGPTIEANTGDTIRVVVNNHMPLESTTIHWHGIDQRNSTWMDGVHGVTQCGIPPGASFTYEFILADQRGSFWYHSHVSVQYTDGMYGPLIIHDPTEMIPKVDDEKIIMIGDVYHQPSEQLLTDYLGTASPWSPGMGGMEPPPSNFLLNGRHVLNCSTVVNISSPCTGGSLFSTRVKSGDRVRLRLISHSTNIPFWFTLDSHVLEIVEIDGVEVKPVATTRVYLNPGQRYSVLVNATQSVGNYLMRATAARSCFHLAHSHAYTAGLEAMDFQTTGVLSYDGTAAGSKPLGEAWNIKNSTNIGVGKEPWDSGCHDLPFDLAKPLRGRDAYEVGPRNFHSFRYEMHGDPEIWRTFINETRYTALSDDATLWKVPPRETLSKAVGSNFTSLDFGPGQHVLVSPDTNMAAQIIINSGHMMSHPWHLHGQNFQIVGWGSGPFGKSTTKWNLENPLRRDTVTVPGNSHVVIRLLADNPGVWALHCHILWHAEGGMFLSVAQRLDELRGMLEALGPSDGESNGVVRKFCSTGSA